MNAQRLSMAIVMTVTLACGPFRGGPERRPDAELRYAIIPRPALLQPLPGEMTLAEGSRIVLPSDSAEAVRAIAERWAARIRASSGLALPLVPAPATLGASDVTLEIEPGLMGSAEGYRLEVAPTGARLVARSRAGIAHGLETLRQLLPAAIEAGRNDFRLSIPSVRIEDSPRFPYRGMHLDVGRHFFPVEFVKRYIDLLVLYKFNTFHWHLTEDQGWRIEIRRYPRLTEVGSRRRETIVARNFDPYVGDNTPYSGFYTQDQIREVVAYATDRSITVIPEIEMPGHSLAALAAYPELACTPGPFEVGTRWGVYDDIYCPSVQTFEFLEGVLTEVMELFPSRYIHIGGDEAPKKRWKESALAQEVIRREGLADEAELQSWFIRRIEAFLRRHGRRLIGWDEILEGGLAPDATVMSWRGIEGGVEAARHGHDVIMTPTSHVYFDYYQGDSATEPLAIGGFTPLEKVYAFEPVPPQLSEAEARHVLGAQGNVWTEYMKTPEHVQYMVLPRMIALAEVVWTRAPQRDYSSFLERLKPHLSRLDALGIRYRDPFRESPLR